MPKRRYLRATACLFALLLSSCLVGAAACDPNTQSCAPITPPVIGGGSGGQSCTPSPGGATCDGSGPAAQGNGSNTDQGAGNPINLINGNKYQREVDMPALPGVLGALQATEALKFLLGLGRLLTDRLLTFDALTLRFREVPVRRNPRCRLCGERPGPITSG